MTIGALVNDDLTKNPAVRRFWNAYATAAALKRVKFTVFRLGDSDELADELLALVLAGIKRARTSLPREFTAKGWSVPKPGDCSIILDGAGVPRCIIRTVHVETKPMSDVDEHFAWENGGGDRSLAWWMSAHTRYFKRQGAREGFAVDQDTEVVLERFQVVWPPEFADRHALD